MWHVLIFLGLGVATGSTQSLNSGTDAKFSLHNTDKDCAGEVSQTIDLKVGTCGSVVAPSGVWPSAINAVGVIKHPANLGLLYCLGESITDCQANLDARLQSDATSDAFDAPHTGNGAGCLTIGNPACNGYGAGAGKRSFSLSGEITVDEDPCFPSSSMITKADGTPSRIDALKEGDEIVAATAEGILTTDTVSLLSIAKPEVHAKSLLALTTAANTTLILTPEHHVPIGEKCCSTLKKAKEVAVGHTVWAVKDGAAAATTITAISKANGRGLHSPVLTHGGFPVVDGLVTSFDSIDKVELAKFGLAPLLTACKMTDTCAKFRELFFAGDREYVEALRRRGL